MITIKILPVQLTDGSHVYDVVTHNTDSGDLSRWLCISDQDAYRFAAKLEQLVNAHVLADAQLIVPDEFALQ